MNTFKHNCKMSIINNNVYNRLLAARCFQATSGVFRRSGAEISPCKMEPFNFYMVFNKNKNIYIIINSIIK